MEILKVALLLFSAHQVLAGHSHYSHVIPVEGYETKLHFLGQHVEIPKPPVKVIKITKTVAVKVPVPYPVKVKEKVPYPVHVAKPYPVPVPQIIKVPHVVTVPQKASHDNGWSGGNDHGSSGSDDSYYGQRSSQLGDSHEGNGIGRAYEVQDDSPSASPSYAHDHHNSEGHSGGNDSGNVQSFGHDDGSAGGGGQSYGPTGNTYSYGGNDGGKLSFDVEAKSYDDAINEYLKNHGLNGLSNQNSGFESSNADNSHYH